VIKKGVVATDNPNGTFTPTPTPAGKWKAFGTSCPRFNAPITHATLPGLINSNLSNVDANDWVTFAIAIENTGGAPAYDIQLDDIIPCDPLDKPSCFAPDYSTLCIRRGDGSSIAFTSAIGGHCRRTITFAPGVFLAPGSPTNVTGTNIAIITFNARLNPDVQPGCCDNRADLLRYSSQAGGPDFVGAGLTPPFSDTATVCVNPILTKSLVASSEAHTAGSNLTIGEIARFRLLVTLPETGVLTNFQISDALPPGLKFLNDNSARIAFVSNGPGITRAPALSSPLFNSATIPSSSTLHSMPSIPAGVIFPVPANCGDPVVFNLGAVQNNDNDYDLESIVIEFNALVCNVPGNINGTQLPNSFNVSVGGNQIASSNAVTIAVTEPTLTIKKSASPSTVAQGGTVTYTVTIKNPGPAQAFDVQFADTLPAGLTFSTGSTTATGGCSSTSSSSPAVTCSNVPVNGTVTITYKAVANPASCPATLTNQANVTWTSLPGLNGTAVNPTWSVTPGSSGHPDDGERNGTTPPLTLNNYAASASAAVTVQCKCVLIDHEAVTCDPSGTFGYSFTATNFSGGVVTTISFIPSGNITITPSSANIPPLPNGSSTTVTVAIGGPGAVSGANVCFDVHLGAPAIPGCTVHHCVTLPNCQTACAPPPPGMVGWWPMNESNGATVVNDIAGFNNQGIPKPGAQLGLNAPSAAPGEVLGALFFVGNYLEVAPHTELDFGQGDFSIDCWIKPVDCSHGTGSFFSGILDKLSGSTGFVFYLDQPTSGVAKLYLKMNGSTPFVSVGTIATLGTPVWSHVAVTVSRPSSGSAIGTFYINGLPAGTFTPPAGSVTNTLPMWIGKTRIPGGNCETTLDELELFNRALTAGEVKSIADAKSAGKCHCAAQPPHMVSWWRLDETSGNTVVDSKGPPNGTTSANIGSDPSVAVPPKVGSALFFVNSNASVPSVPKNNFGTGNFSIDAWVRGGTHTTPVLGIVDKLDTSTGTPSGFALFVGASNNSVQLTMGNGTSSPATFTSNPTFTYFQWQHVAVTVQRTGGGPIGTFYINGIPAGTFVPPLTSVTNALPLLIGSYRQNINAGSACQSCEVALDEIEIFDDVVSSTDIKAIFDSGSVGKCP
jgi:uncharacterized repeat protein (TIGR01451 family)